MTFNLHLEYFMCVHCWPTYKIFARVTFESAFSCGYIILLFVCAKRPTRSVADSRCGVVVVVVVAAAVDVYIFVLTDCLAMLLVVCCR